jgi:isopentenyl-diphosphate Delta-isomerase
VRTGERVILVDHADTAIGTAPKLAAHRHGLLHRALSVFVLDADGRLLIQRRAAGKYHSAGLWANTCCSHPRPGETTVDAAHRRLREEMGFDCDLDPVGAFEYRADVGAGLIEHEYDHLFMGRWGGTPRPDAQEVAGWRWAHPDELFTWIRARPADFAAWFPLALREPDVHRALRPRATPTGDTRARSPRRAVAVTCSPEAGAEDRTSRPPRGSG